MLGHAVVGEQGVQEDSPLRVIVRKSRIQLQSEVFSPRVLRLVMSFVGTMVLNAKL